MNPSKNKISSKVPSRDHWFLCYQCMVGGGLSPGGGNRDMLMQTEYSQKIHKKSNDWTVQHFAFDSSLTRGALFQN